VENWQQKMVTILGLGKSGYSAAKYLKQKGADVLISESGELKGDQIVLAEELKQLGIAVESGGHSDKAIEEAELVITSPGIPPTSPVIQKAENLKKEVICDIELAYRETKTPIIAITGTNGKSTTTALISHILEFNGLKAPSCGNIGSPVMDYVQEQSPLNYLVMEVSSYQLYYTKSFSPFIAVWLNLTPDHLDWHGSMEAYIAAKDNILGANTYAILNMDDPIVYVRPAKSKVLPFSLSSTLKDKDPAAFLDGNWLCYRMQGKVNKVCKTTELPIIGRHNMENALAAISASVLAGLSNTQISKGLKTFKALAHRLEYVDTIDGIACYNDSKATNPESAIKALQSFEEKIVLIAGGKDKGTDLVEFAENVRDKTVTVILIGEAKERFEKAFKKVGVSNIHTASSLAEAVDFGLKLKLGPLVLSPACASYDMFKNFEQRGDVFKDLVRAKQTEKAR
jgi:UDP-N-acetylmuramoylalanine--D-glutamate ligase